MATSDEEIATRIKETRERLGISQGALAQTLAMRGHDFRQQTVYKIENNQRRVLASELVAIADALDVTATSLLGVTTDRAPILLSGARLHESGRNLQAAAVAYARAMLSFAMAADSATALHPGDEQFANEGLLKQTPAWMVSADAFLNLEANFKINRPEEFGPHAMAVLETLRVDYNHFHGKHDG